MRTVIPFVIATAIVLVGCHSPSTVHTQSSSAVVAAPSSSHPLLITTPSTNITTMAERFMSAKTYIWQLELHDYDVKDSGSQQFVYVLILHGESGMVRPVIFKTFDSKGMEDMITFFVKHGDIKAGSDVFYIGATDIAVPQKSSAPTDMASAFPKTPDWRPSVDELKGFEAFCQNLGLKFFDVPRD